MEFLKHQLGIVQERIKDLTLIIKNRSKFKNSSMNSNQVKVKTNTIIDYHLPDKEYSDKSEKIRVN